MKELYIFDLDGTITESKSPMSLDMSVLMYSLLRIKKVAIITGGRLSQIQSQFIDRLFD